MTAQRKPRQAILTGRIPGAVYFQCPDCKGAYVQYVQSEDELEPETCERCGLTFEVPTAAMTAQALPHQDAARRHQRGRA